MPSRNVALIIHRVGGPTERRKRVAHLFDRVVGVIVAPRINCKDLRLWRPLERFRGTQIWWYELLSEFDASHPTKREPVMAVLDGLANPERETRREPTTRPPRLRRGAMDWDDVRVFLDRDPQTVDRGKLGGQKGGLARAAGLTKDQRSQIARKGARGRWAKAKQLVD
jgi:hypothetical protein